jgi:hypothetical protein
MLRFFLTLLICFFGIINIAKSANNENYQIENIATKSKAKSPSIARNLAVASARRDGFLILLTRLELNTVIADEINDDEIADMVSSEQIQNEKIAGNNYSATLNITFAKNFVDHILQKKTSELKNTPNEINLNSKNIANAENILLIAGVANKKRLILWEEENQWRYALNRYLGKKVKKNFIVVQPDLDNIAVVNAENIIDLNYNNIEPLLNKYNVSSAYTIILNYDNIENKILLDVNHIRKNQNKQIHLNFVNVDRLDYEQLLDIVAKKAVDYLANAQVASDKNLNNNLIRLGIYLNDFDSWINVKKKIENCNFINQINIESLSRNYAVISVNNTDLNNKIEDNLARLNFSAQKKDDNFYTLTIN